MVRHALTSLTEFQESEDAQNSRLTEEIVPSAFVRFCKHEYINDEFLFFQLTSPGCLERTIFEGITL